MMIVDSEAECRCPQDTGISESLSKNMSLRKASDHGVDYSVRPVYVVCTPHFRFVLIPTQQKICERRRSVVRHGREHGMGLANTARFSCAS